MLKADRTVIKETQYVAFWIIVFSLLMQGVFIVVKKWDYTVLLGNLWGSLLMTANFFFMGISVQKAVAKDEVEAKKTMKLSHTVRTFVLFIGAVLGVVLPFFSSIAVIIPFLFPRIAIMLRPLCNNKSKGE